MLVSLAGALFELMGAPHTRSFVVKARQTPMFNLVIMPHVRLTRADVHPFGVS